MRQLDDLLDKLNLDDPNRLSLLLSVIASVVSFLSILYFYDKSLTYPALSLFTYLVGSIIFFYLVFYVLIRFFVYRKVLLIFKAINQLKNLEKTEEEVAKNVSLKSAQVAVFDWAEDKVNQIEILKEREKYRREYLGNISHELKTPIFNIQGYILTLLDGAMNDPELCEKYLKRTNKSIDRMINIVNDLDLIAQLESGVLKLKISKFDMYEVVKDVFDQLADKAKARNVKLKFKKNYDRPILVKADQKRIEQLLINLIINAIKYSKPEGGLVEVAFYELPDQIMTEISDDGVGIPQEDLPRIFERFYRVDKSRSRDAGGSGLGLAIVKHIIESHRQSINVRSAEGIGSAFSFTLSKAD
ncbi:two-component sensor histidine kinase [Thermaurantimonas aggregans]|uniref:histidine kinase n=1 Tax=Thermaurantimonas aggregans TaxID=2173829 RepID=A0A401XNU0_9FLAO|nr:ATP-binding protein [Thermaurantimonas aggregans]MCX8149491.1 ATP-binding protein [Thermaurantimonas aggregans]GCD78665.1 two-component sensor histidine kinase [Thermaurantimonas aggregans]